MSLHADPWFPTSFSPTYDPSLVGSTTFVWGSWAGGRCGRRPTRRLEERWTVGGTWMSDTLRSGSTRGLSMTGFLSEGTGRGAVGRPESQTLGSPCGLLSLRPSLLRRTRRDLQKDGVTQKTSPTLGIYIRDRLHRS